MCQKCLRQKIIFAFRGAEIVENLRTHEITRQIAEENAYLDRLREKMETIKQSASIVLISRKNEKSSHDHAIRRGNYQMFDEETEQKEMLEERIATPVEFSQTTSSLRLSSTHSVAQSMRKLTVSKAQAFKNFYKNCLAKIVLRMHKSSREYRYIYKLLIHEKKALKNAVSPGLHASYHFM